MHEEDQHTFNINVSNFYSKKIGTYPIVKRWLIPNNKNVWECPKTETDLPILHITFDVQKGSPREQCRPTMEPYEVNFNRLKKIKYLQLYYGNKSADGGIKLLK